MKLYNCKKLNDFKYLLIAALIPCCVMLISIAAIDAVPFGDNTIIWWDSNGQYLNFLQYFKTVLLGENDLFYSFSKELGGDFFSLAAYYLFSPFNVLFLFSNHYTAPLFFTIIVVLKICTCAVTFLYTSTKLYGEENRSKLLVFSTAYALIGYNIVFEFNIMWLDGVYLLPLIFLGIYNIWYKDRYLLYTVSLLLAIVAEYYIGFMLCLASVLIFLAVMLSREALDFRERLSKSLKYALSSLIAGFGSAIVWLPSLMFMRGERDMFASSLFSFSTTFPLLNIASKIVPGSISSATLLNGYPNIFCTTAVLFLVLLFFLNPRFSRLKKLTAAAMAASLLLSFWIGPLNVIWHAFTNNFGFHYRYSFIFSFFLILIAQHQFLKGGDLKPMHKLISALFLLLVFLYVYRKHFDFVYTEGILISLLCLFIVCTALLLNKSCSSRFLSWILLAAVLIECGYNSISTLSLYEEQLDGAEMAPRRIHIQSTLPALEYIKETDEGFYRLESTELISQNSPLFYNYNGLTHFSSTRKELALDFFEKMGIPGNSAFSIYGQGTTAEAESLMGIKYVLSGQDLSAKAYEQLDTQEGLQVYRNNNALPMAYIADSSICSVKAEDSLFSWHNSIWHGISGLDQDVLIEENDFEVILNNLTYEADADGSHLFTMIDESVPASLCFDISISHELPLYFYFYAPINMYADIYVNGEYAGNYFTDSSWSIRRAGSFSKGDTVRIEIAFSAYQLVLSDADFYYEDLAALEMLSGSIKQNTPELIKHSNSRLSGSFTNTADEFILFSIPYDEGWELEIDNEPAELVMVMDCFMAARAAPGEHSFELKYTPVGFKEGLAISSLALAAALVWIITARRKSKN